LTVANTLQPYSDGSKLMFSVCVTENPTSHPIYQTDATGPFQLNSSTSCSSGREFDPRWPYERDVHEKYLPRA
jgi:hypothetical protein